MLTALLDDRPVIAKACERWEGPFQCKACHQDAFLVKGDIRAHHFRHRPEHIDCTLERGETPAHRACKEAICDSLMASGEADSVELERPIGTTNIADVFAVIRGFPVAIEVQRSTLSVNTIRQRTMDYHRHGVFVLWLGLLTDAVCFDAYSPAAWERWCHATYGGRVYYWVSDDLIQPIHFSGHKDRIPRVTWPGSAGREYAFGGYDKFSKTRRTPDHGERVRITQDFRPVQRPEWSGRTVRVPRCSIYVDRQAPWWQIDRSIAARPGS